MLSGTDHLSNLNIALINWIRSSLEIETKLTFASELESTGHKADLLLHLCQQVDGEEYVSPPGSKEYLGESPAFENAGIPVRFFDFTHPEYSQRYNEFIPYMSAIDILFNEGPKSMKIIQNSGVIKR